MASACAGHCSTQGFTFAKIVAAFAKNYSPNSSFVLEPPSSMAVI
jgi:hypothetical protein